MFEYKEIKINLNINILTKKGKKAGSVLISEKRNLKAKSISSKTNSP